MSEPFWKTAISRVEPNKIIVRGYNLMDLVGRYNYADLTYLLWRGELPPANHSRMMDALLTVCIEHSLNAPSVDATRFVASSGVPLQAAVSAGVSAIGDWHGGAIEEAAKLFQEGTAFAIQNKLSMDDAANRLLQERVARHEKVPGYGHPTHTQDPRTKKLLEIAEQNDLCGNHVALAQALEGLTEKFFRRHLILNVDGSIAALISEMGFDWRIGKGFFIVSRTPGLVAHAFEQMYNDKPYKAPGWKEITYTGLAERQVPTKK
ncbi:MAG TPA: citryl-CoA lyase [Terriglobales bacterium]|nr:citryl-CoA lyase [Terriglobales bacterium]